MTKCPKCGSVAAGEDTRPPLPEFDAPGFRWVQKSEKGPGRKSGRRSGIYEEKPISPKDLDPGFDEVVEEEEAGSPSLKISRFDCVYEDKDGKIRPAVPGEVVPGFRWVQKSEKGVGVEPGAHKSLFWYLGVPAILNLILIIWLVWRVGWPICIFRIL